MPRLGLDNLCWSCFHEDWRDEFASPYEAAEEFLTYAARRNLLLLMDDVDRLFGQQTAEQRRKWVPREGFSTRDENYVDAWLLAVRQRARQALLGDHSQPLTDPEGPAYDVLPPYIGGWLQGDQAEDVAAQVLAAHAGYVQLLEQLDAPRSVVMRTDIGGARTVQLRDTGAVVPAPYGCVVLHRLVRPGRCSSSPSVCRSQPGSRRWGCSSAPICGPGGGRSTPTRWRGSWCSGVSRGWS